MANVDMTDVNCFGENLNLPDSFVDDMKQTIFDAAHPIGSIYIQYPKEKTPAAVYNKNGITSQWSDTAVSFSGAFFRAEGGSAKSFNGGKQDGQNKYHRHSATHQHNMQHTHTRGTMEITGQLVPGWRDINLDSNVLDGAFKLVQGGVGNFGWGASGGFDFPRGNFYASRYWGGLKCSGPSKTTTDGASDEYTNNYGGDEFRPENLTIKIWKRIA